jgi:hypothetical protein
MAAPSRHQSPSTDDNLYEEYAAQAVPNAYEVEREKMKRALHDSVQLALREAGFVEAVKLRSAFIGEGNTETPSSNCEPKPRR